MVPFPFWFYSMSEVWNAQRFLMLQNAQYHQYPTNCDTFNVKPSTICSPRPFLSKEPEMLLLSKASNDMTSPSTHGCMICQWLRACALKKSGQNHQRLCKSLPSHVTIRVIVERNIYSVGTERWSGVDDRINLNPPKGLSGPLGCINCNKPPSNRMPADHQKGPTKVEVSRGDGVSYIRLGFWYRPKSP